jgi:hypothetical protein
LTGAFFINVEPSSSTLRSPSIDLHVPLGRSITPSFKAKLNAHSMSAHESSFHTCRTENGYKKTNVTLYYIYYRIMSLTKYKVEHSRNTAAEIHHKTIGNHSPSIPHRSTLILLQLLNNSLARLSTLMVGTQHVWEINDMHARIARIKL